MEVLRLQPGLRASLLTVVLLATPAAAGSDCVATAEAARPVLAAHSLDGAAVSLTSERGRPIVLELWATWCSACPERLNQAEALAATTLPERLTVIGLSVDRDPEDARVWLAANLPNHHLHAWQAAPGTTFTALDIGALPATLLLDSTGRILRHHEGSEPAGFDALLRQARECARRPPHD